MNETYQSIGYQNDSLMHHGVPGMRWGHRKSRIQTGIQRIRASIKASKERQAKAKMEKLEKKAKLAEIKNRIKTANIANKNERSKIKSEILNRKIKDKEREREYKEKEFESSDNRKEKRLLLKEKEINMKQNKLDREHKRLTEKKTVSSGNRNSGSTADNAISPITVYKNRASFTDEELSQALKRMTTEKQIRALAAEEIEAKRNPVVKFATKYASKAVDQAMTNIINKGVTAATNGLMTKLLGQKDQEKKQEKKSESSSSPVKSAYETVKESVEKVKAAKVNPKDIPKYNTGVSWRTVETVAETVSSTPIWEAVKRLGPPK